MEHRGAIAILGLAVNATQPRNATVDGGNSRRAAEARDGRISMIPRAPLPTKEGSLAGARSFRFADSCPDLADRTWAYFTWQILEAYFGHIWSVCHQLNVMRMEIYFNLLLSSVM